MNYRMYGLHIDSDIPLPAPVCGMDQEGDDEDRRIDIRFGGAIPVPKQPGPGDVLATLDLAEGRGFALTTAGDNYLLRYYGLCQFEISLNLKKIRAFTDPSSDRRWMEGFLAANVFGQLLALAEEPCLHASAVSLEEGVVAFVGGSGSGKSTLAALVGGQGGCLLTDDLLRLKFGSGEVDCFGGSRQLRLKGEAAQLAGEFPQGFTETVDERVAVDFDCKPPSERLAAIVCPKPSKGTHQFVLERLGAKDAFVALVAASYLPAWKKPYRARNYFRHGAEIVRRVPVFSAVVPWGPPFSTDVAQGLLSLARTTGSAIPAPAGTAGRR